MNRTIIVALAFIVLLALVANPTGLWMPTQVEMIFGAFLVVVAALYVGLMFNESAADEREEVLRNSAARMGYMAGVAVLALAVVVETFTRGWSDQWLFASLGAMILVRLAVRVFKK